MEESKYKLKLNSLLMRKIFSGYLKFVYALLDISCLTEINPLIPRRTQVSPFTEI